MSRINYADLEFEVFPGVYEPSDDSILLAKNLEVSEGEKVLDLGTGCGFLAIIAAKAGGRVIATDVNPNAIECARFNAQTQGVDDAIDFRLGDLFSPVSGEFDLIIFNPPYLPTDNSESLSSQLELAWNGGSNGRKVIDRFLAEVLYYLKPRGRILLVQSSLSNLDVTVERLRKMKFQVLVKSKKFFFERIYLIDALRT